MTGRKYIIELLARRTKEARREERRYAYWLSGEMKRLSGDACRGVYSWLRERPQYREIIEEHLEATKGTDELSEWPVWREWREWRERLAILRAVEPLSAHTGGVERSCVELHRADQLKPYLQNALANERILLDRENAKVRLENRRRHNLSNLSWLDEVLPQQEERTDVEDEESGGRDITG